MKNTGALNLSKHREESFNTGYSTFSDSSISDTQNDDPKEPAWKCRYTVTLITFLMHLLFSTHRTIMSLVIVAMVNNTAVNQNSKVKSSSCPDLIKNSTEEYALQGLKPEGEFFWSPEIQGYILGSLYFGQILTPIISGRLAERYGCKWISVGILLLISILTMLIPPFSRWNAPAMIVIQTFRGLLLGMPPPCVAILIANWSPKTERGLLYSLIQPAHFLGPGLGYILSGYISESPAGWPYAFYAIGIPGLLLAVYVFFFIAENPKEHPRISKAELNCILSQQETELLKKRPKLPWKKMLTSIPFYALIFVIFGRVWSLFQFWLVHSTFLGTILHFPIGENGLLSAIPFFLATVISIVTSWISGSVEKAKIVSVDRLRKFWVLISSVLYSLCLLGMYFAGCSRNLSVIFSILSMGSVGLGTPGAYVVIQDMSPTFAGTLQSISTTTLCLPGVFLPLIVGYLTKDKQTLEQWNKVFFISFGVVMSSAITFAIFGSAKIQPWNFVDEENEYEKLKDSENNENYEVARFRRH